MPSIIPGWVYSLFASLIVGVIIVASCSLATVNVKNEAESTQLTNIEEYVATQSLIILTHVAQNNENVTQYLDLPTQVGNQVYWICIENSSSGAWVSSGLGLTVDLSQSGFCVPVQVSASGVYISSYGRPVLQCFYMNQTVSLTLSGV
jgi:hypothetical protein